MSETEARKAAERERDARLDDWQKAVVVLGTTIAERDEAIRLRDLHWREVESLREWKDKLEAEVAAERAINADLCSQAGALEAERDGLLAHFHLDNAVCLCGCPASEHEDNGEDGEQCEHEDHVCLRTCPAIRDIHQSMLADLARRPAPPADAATEAVRETPHDPDPDCEECHGKGYTLDGPQRLVNGCRCNWTTSPAPAPSAPAMRRCEIKP